MSYKRIIMLLIGTLIVLIVGDVIVTDEMFLQDYIRGTFTETIGIIITIVFIERALSKFEEKKDKENERNKIIRYSKILENDIEGYLRYAYRVVTPIEKRSINDIETLNRDFTFNDMVDIFKPSLLIYDDMEPVVFKCIASSKKMYTSIEKMISDIDFEYYPEVSDLLINSLSPLNRIDLYDGIKFHAKDNKQIQTMVEHMIKESSPEPEYIESNIINTYIMLYKSIQTNKDFIKKYEEILRDIKNDK